MRGSSAGAQDSPQSRHTQEVEAQHHGDQREEGGAETDVPPEFQINIIQCGLDIYFIFCTDLQVN